MEDKTLGILLDVVGELFSDEISIAVSNKEEYIYYRPSKRIDLKISAGDPIKEGTIAHKAMVTKQKPPSLLTEMFSVFLIMEWRYHFQIMARLKVV